MQWLQILTGDCRAILPTLEAGSVQCCVTSPPYWGLRDYGTATWEGGDSTGLCQHRIFDDVVYWKSESTSTLQSPSKTNSHAQHGFKTTCGHCGARRIDSQLGLESTPEEYLTKMVAVFREVWRVLRDDGTLWLNMGDSYAGSSMSGGGRESSTLGGTHHEDRNGCRFNGVARSLGGLKPKDLCMMPARLAMALQADGWYLRSDIIWHKPNPMPESVTDRPTKAHEYIFLLTKAERYYYDAEAIREPVQYDPRNKLWGNTECTSFHDHSEDLTKGMMQQKPEGFVHMSNPLGRNKRTVWTVATQAYTEAHFATFPEDLIKPCIMAGSRIGDTVLDPFAGSGTTGKVAIELGRKAILIELNPDYIELARERTFVTPGFL